MTEETLTTLLAMADLPEPCGCGGTKAVVVTVHIEETLDRALLMEVACTECGAESFIPDEVAEAQRDLRGDEYYHPVYYLKDGELIHWKSKKGEQLRVKSLSE